jgi:indolepyruvate ferredoxin oxidoreductase alpha subunit
LIVIDASLAVAACLTPARFTSLPSELVAPALMWSEARSALHELTWRGEVAVTDAELARAALEDAPVEQRNHAELGDRAWRIADALGWAKTYDAEYVALADLLGCRLATIDNRLLRGAVRLGFVVSPADL